VEEIMTKCITLITSVFLLTALQASALGQGAPPPPAKKQDPLRLLQDALAKLEKLEAGLTGKKKMGRKQLDRLGLDVKEVRLQIREFLMDVEDKKTLVPASKCCPCETVETDTGGEEAGDGQLPEEVEVLPMADEQFEELLASLKYQGFADDRLAVLSAAVKESHMTVAQTRKLLTQFSFPDDKLSALRLLKPVIVDSENVFQLYGSFVHSSDKEEARKILEAE